jgi:hypothetical protein
MYWTRMHSEEETLPANDMLFLLSLHFASIKKLWGTD